VGLNRALKTSYYELRPEIQICRGVQMAEEKGKI